MSLLCLSNDDRIKIDKCKYQKDIVNYIISNRTFFESLSDDDVNYYFKTFKSYRRYRIKLNIISFFKCRVG